MPDPTEPPPAAEPDSTAPHPPPPAPAEGGDAAATTTPAPPPRTSNAAPPAESSDRKSKILDQAAPPSEEKRKSEPVSRPKEGKGAIATADKGAVELAGKVKNFFSQAEGQRLKDEATKPLRRPKKIYQNSYRLEAHVPYSRDRVQKILEATLEEMISGVYYVADTASDLAIKMAEKIRQRVLALKFDRYKVIVMTNVGPLNRQGVHIGFRGLLDAERDTYNMATAKSNHAFATAVIYAIYIE